MNHFVTRLSLIAVLALAHGCALPPGYLGCHNDFDLDGHVACGPDGVHGTPDDDCNDRDASIWPGAPEQCDDIDHDCDGGVEDLADADGDGRTRCQDCDDEDASIYPGAPDACDGVDSNCDPGAPIESDADLDGSPVCVDCDDNNPNVFPGAGETCDGFDSDCDPGSPAFDVDADLDGVPVCAGDCDDAHGGIHPGAYEYCDGRDNDCDGELRDDEVDLDGDGRVCLSDCDESDPTIYLGAPEACDGVDSGCDGPLSSNELDLDGDGFLQCAECDDGSSDTYPGAPELCDGLDNDCDGTVAGEGDVDDDGWPACVDCADYAYHRHPGAVELCNGADDDCDGVVPASETTDLDGDGYVSCADCDDLLGGDRCSVLLDWSQDIAAAAQRPATSNAMEQAAAGAAGAEPCVSTVTLTSGTPPSFAVNSGNYQLTPTSVVELLSTSGCPAGQGTWSGSAAVGTIPSVPGLWSPGSYSADWFEAEDLAISGGLQLDGYFFEEQEEKYGQSLQVVSDAAEADATYQIPAVGLATPGSLLAPGDWDLEYEWERMSFTSGGTCPAFPYPEPLWSSSIDLFLSADWTPVGAASVSVVSTLEYVFSGACGVSPTGPTGGGGGCGREPASGTVTVVESAPGGESTVVELVFDGATSCDGCGAVAVDGALVGSWCGGSGFAVTAP